MLRVRIDGGALTTEQLRVIGEISRDFARDTADITDRQNIQLHWIRIEDVPEIWRRLEAVGLQTDRGLRRLPRASSSARPVAGIAADEIIDPTPAIEEITAPLHRRPRALQPAAQVQDRHHRARQPTTSCTRSTTSRFVGVEHPELGPGYDLWVGGGLSTNPRLAERLGVFVAEDDVPRRLGRRRLRLPRLRLPPAAQQGPAEVPARRLGPGEVPRGARDRVPRPRRCPTARRPRPPTDRGDHVGVHEQKDGRYYVGAAPVVGRSAATLLIRLADIVEAHGSHARAAHPAPEAARPRRRAGPRRRPRRTALDELGLDGPAAARSAATRWPAPASSSASSPSSRPRPPRPRDRRRARGAARRRRRPDRRPDLAPRQRLPQLLRPHPDRRHRAQGPDRHRRRRRAGRGLPGPPRRRPRSTTVDEPASAARSAA